jgi:hypothetical protein
MPRPDGLEMAGRVGLGHGQEHRDPVVFTSPPRRTIWLVMKLMSWTRSQQHSTGAVMALGMTRCADEPRARDPYPVRSGG